GKQFYVENIGGAGGNVGMGQAARAAPDGYTILVVPPNIVVNPALYNKVPYDPYKDFDPVTIAVSAPLVLAVHPSLPRFRLTGVGRTASQGRQAARAGGSKQDAIAGPAGRTNHDGSGLSGHRGRGVVRHHRSSSNAQGNRRAASSRDRQ